MQLLNGAPREGIPADVVRDALRLHRGVSIRHGVDVLNLADQRIPGERLRFTSGSVDWNYRPPELGRARNDATSETRRTARLKLAGPVGIPILARRFRLWTELRSPLHQQWVRFWLGTFTSTLPGRNDDGTSITRELVLADKTHGWRQLELLEPVTVPAGTDPIAYVKNRLSTKFGETAFDMPATTYRTLQGRTFQAGTSELAFMNALLEMAGYDALSPDEAGRARSVPLAALAARGATPEMKYGPGFGKITIPGSVVPLLVDVPNVLRFVARQGPSLAEEGNGIRTIVNERTGPGSIDGRTDKSTDPNLRLRARVTHEVQVEAESQQELDAIAAGEAGKYFAGGGLRFTGSIGLNPLISDRDVLEIVKPRLELAGLWNLTSWSYPLHPDITSPDDVTMKITAEARVA